MLQNNIQGSPNFRNNYVQIKYDVSRTWTANVRRNVKIDTKESHQLNNQLLLKLKVRLMSKNLFGTMLMKVSLLMNKTYKKTKNKEGI